MKKLNIDNVLDLTTLAIAMVVTLLAWLILTTPSAKAETLGNHGPAIAWLWSATSPAVNRSTEALATGHAVRAVRLARTAADTARHHTDRLIADHNLCLALLTGRAAADAEPHCRSALTAPETYTVARIRGALLVVADTMAPAQGASMPLALVMRANISRTYAMTKFSAMAAVEMVPMHGFALVSHD